MLGVLLEKVYWMSMKKRKIRVFFGMNVEVKVFVRLADNISFLVVVKLPR